MCLSNVAIDVYLTYGMPHLLLQAGWYSGQGLMSQDSDKVLQTHLPLLLCQRHNMICNPHF
jgi:hypothetical protein